MSEAQDVKPLEYPQVETDPIRRWTFEAHRTDIEGKLPKGLKVNIFGVKANAEKMRAYLQEAYNKYTASHRQDYAVELVAVPCEQVSEETKISFDDAIKEVVITIRAMQMVINTVMEDAPMEQKKEFFDIAMDAARKRELDEQLCLRAAFEIGRRQMTAGIEEAIQGILAKASHEPGQHMHVISVKLNPDGSSEAVELTDKDKWN